ncbi:MAG TPA: ABC transporter ATP-binding protein [Aliidongia sp.]|nr:ABC transporter ATP-binding protein [Aliidongia sp.]
MTLLELRDLSLDYAGKRSLDRLSLTLERGRILGLVGESGSGKSSLALALMDLLPGNAALDGQILLNGTDLRAITPHQRAALRGRKLAMVFQDPMTALNPLFPIGRQLVDAQRARHPEAGRRALLDRGREMLRRVGIADPEARLKAYPHELSGGMRQRVLIAMALLCEPDLLIADEPTTALDVTIEAQIMGLFEELRDHFSGSILFISHSLALVSRLADEVAVLYAGHLIETAPARTLFALPAHPYTQALIACETGEGEGKIVPTIPGAVPAPGSDLPGCSFAPRCPARQPLCIEAAPPLRDVGQGRRAACHFA